MGVRERGDQFRRLIRSAVDDLFDQRSPVGRLALLHPDTTIELIADILATTV